MSAISNEFMSRWKVRSTALHAISIMVLVRYVWVQSLQWLLWAASVESTLKVLFGKAMWARTNIQA